MMRANLDSITRFTSLDIDGCDTGALAMLSETKMAIEIFKIDIDKNVNDTCELHFLGLLDATVRLRGFPWLGSITAHHASSDSPYLIERRDSSPFLNDLKRLGTDMANWRDYYHFSISFEGSSIDVVAQDFVFCVVAKRPIETDFEIP